MEAPPVDAIEIVLPPATQAFITHVVRRFRSEVAALLERRRVRQAAFDAGVMPRFLDETEALRRRTWWIPAVPPELQDRRVELLGSVDRRAIVDGLSSGAQVFIADFEDATVPTWARLIDGQRNLVDAVRGRISYRQPETGREYALTARTAVLTVRPRGLHLLERHFQVDGQPVPAALFDFAVFFFNNAIELLRRGSAPYFYLPKLESHLEARLWNDVFSDAEHSVGLLTGTIRATVTIETLPAAFEMDEILFELRPHAAGLSWDHRDYLFSAVKARRHDPAFLLPDPAQLTSHAPALRACARLLVQTCHRRDAHAIGNMTVDVPSTDREWNEAAFARVRDEAAREAGEGHDGTWVAHPGLVPLARAVFDEHIALPNQIESGHGEAAVTAADLLATPAGARTEAGLREHIAAGIRYLVAWLSGTGFVALNGQMADVATLELSRAIVWQWVRHRATLDEGRTVSRSLVQRLVAEEVARVPGSSACHALLGEAAHLFERTATSDDLDEFVTPRAYGALA